MEKIVVIEDMKFYLRSGIGYVIGFNKETCELTTSSTQIEKAIKYDLKEALQIAYILWTHRKHATIEPIFED